MRKDVLLKFLKYRALHLRVEEWFANKKLKEKATHTDNIRLEAKRLEVLRILQLVRDDKLGERAIFEERHFRRRSKERAAYIKKAHKKGK